MQLKSLNRNLFKVFINNQALLRITASLEQRSEHILAQSNLSIAIGEGINVAMESANITLMHGET
ncbi:hypothetical protein IID20_00835 [Patescibacteria group bacterium]|nr:hypothetical protein [Patescibacteria group bacterium]